MFEIVNLKSPKIGFHHVSIICNIVSPHEVAMAQCGGPEGFKSALARGALKKAYNGAGMELFFFPEDFFSDFIGFSYLDWCIVLTPPFTPKIVRNSTQHSRHASMLLHHPL